MNKYNSDLSNCLDIYNFLMDSYIDTIIKLLDTSYSMNLLPFKIIFSLGWIKNYIRTNRYEVLQNGILYILSNKDIIINFDLDKLDELDKDNDDNISIKSCVDNFKHNYSNKINFAFDKNNVDENFLNNSDDMLNLIIEIKNNTKKLNYSDVIIIKKYFELIILILEKIQNIFI